jgi:hypothetical protein
LIFLKIVLTEYSKLFPIDILFRSTEVGNNRFGWRKRFAWRCVNLQSVFFVFIRWSHYTFTYAGPLAFFERRIIFALFIKLVTTYKHLLYSQNLLLKLWTMSLLLLISVADTLTAIFGGLAGTISVLVTTYIAL